MNPANSCVGYAVTLIFSLKLLSIVFNLILFVKYLNNRDMKKFQANIYYIKLKHSYNSKNYKEYSRTMNHFSFYEIFSTIFLKIIILRCLLKILSMKR